MSRTKAERYDVLMSYAPDDAVLAEAVRDRFVEAGFRCSTRLTDLDLESYPAELRPALDAARAYVVLLSRSSVGSSRLLVEVAAAWAVAVPIYVLLNDIRPADVSGFLAQFPAHPLWKSFPKLVTALRALPERVPA